MAGAARSDTDEKIKMRTEYDLYYIENWSLWLDLKILVLTPVAAAQYGKRLLSAIVQPASPGAVNAKLIAARSRPARSRFGILLSGFVIDEPAPYEIYMAGLIAVWALFGLRIFASASRRCWCCWSPSTSAA